MSSKKFLFGGLISGLFASLILLFSFWGIWLLPALGMLLRRVNLLNGAIVVTILGVVGGIIYSLFVRERKLSAGKRVLAGSLLGFAFWLGGVLLLIPVMLGFSPALKGFNDHIFTLAVFVLYGIALANIYERIAARGSAKSLGLGFGLILLAVVATPLLLRGAVSTDPKQLVLPRGYRAEVVVKDLTYPSSLVVAEEGVIYIAESGFSYGPKTTAAKILKLNANGSLEDVADGFEGPINGLLLKDNKLYISHRGKITEFDLRTKDRQDLVTNLPSLGDHHNNDLLLGKDGALYFGQGTATNAGVVGSDNFVYAWADRYPDFHDIPSRDFTLTGENYTSLDLKETDPTAKSTTGAFAPFGQTRQEGETVQGKVPASGALHRFDLETGELSIYADGLRNPYGLTMDREGNIYVSVLGYDDRGVRASTKSPDWIMLVEEGAWYGWPDFAGETPLSDPKFASDRGVNRNPIIQDPPKVTAPLASLPPHYSPMKIAFAPEQFPKQGIFTAIFGDGQPLTEDLKRQVPSGVIVVDPKTGDFEWFVKSKDEERAGRLGDGLKRVIDVKFSDDGKDLYVLDYGTWEFADMAPNPIPETGVLWKITYEGA
ncbi:MAG TPA: hypothetical protein GX528_09475 [Firmicutes bacterium]|nr:hypothetical protein [Bacillota bacterium]